MKTYGWFKELHDRVKDTPEYKRELEQYDREEKIAELKEAFKMCVEEPKKSSDSAEYIVVWPPCGHYADSDGATWGEW